MQRMMMKVHLKAGFAALQSIAALWRCHLSEINKPATICRE